MESNFHLRTGSIEMKYIYLIKKNIYVFFGEIKIKNWTKTKYKR